MHQVKVLSFENFLTMSPGTIYDLTTSANSFIGSGLLSDEEIRSWMVHADLFVSLRSIPLSVELKTHRSCLPCLDNTIGETPRQQARDIPRDLTVRGKHDVHLAKPS